MPTEKPLEPNDLFVVVPDHALALLREYREIEQRWMDAPDGSPESHALGEQIKPLRLKLTIWLNSAVARAEEAAANGQ